MKNKIIGCYNKSVILTYVGGAISIIGIAILQNKNLTIAMICLIIAGICDLFDGTIARKCKRNEKEKAFGVEIDSLIDMISFVVFPICILFSISNKWYSVLIGIMYAILGVARLAWFNITTNDEEAKKYFRGLPVAYSALILPIVYVINMLISKNIESIIYTILMGIIAILFICNFKLRKPHGIWYIVYGILAITVTVMLILLEVAK